MELNLGVATALLGNDSRLNTLHRVYHNIETKVQEATGYVLGKEHVLQTSLLKLDGENAQILFTNIVKDVHKDYFGAVLKVIEKDLDRAEYAIINTCYNDKLLVHIVTLVDKDNGRLSINLLHTSEEFPKVELSLDEEFKAVELASPHFNTVAVASYSGNIDMHGLLKDMPSDIKEIVDNNLKVTVDKGLGLVHVF